MAIQSSGPINLSDLEWEFGGSAPISISEYYRSGLYVEDTSFTTTIPYSGAVSLSNYYGTSDEADIVYRYPSANYDLLIESVSDVAFSYVRNQTAGVDRGEGYGGTPWIETPTGFGVLSLVGYTQNMPAFEGSLKSTFENRMDLIFNNKTTGMRDIDYWDTWIEQTVDGIPFTFLNENWTSNFFNSINNQNPMVIEFQIRPGFDY